MTPSPIERALEAAALAMREEIGVCRDGCPECERCVATTTRDGVLAFLKTLRDDTKAEADDASGPRGFFLRNRLDYLNSVISSIEARGE